MSSKKSASVLGGLFKKKPEAPEKPAAGKGAGKSLLTPGIVIAGSVIILFSILAAALEFGSLYPEQTKQTANLQRLSIIFAKKRLDAYVRERQRQVTKLAYSEPVKAVLSEEASLESLNELLSDFLPDLEMFYVLPKGRSEGVTLRGSPISFASRDLVRKAEQNQPTQPDAFFLNDKWHYQLIAPIKAPNGSVTGSVLAIFNTSLMRSSLVTPAGLPEGRLMVKSTGRAKQPLVMASGKGGSGETLTETAPIGQWKIHFEPKDSSQWSLQPQSQIIFIMVAVVGILTALVAFVVSKLAARNIQRDIALLTKHVPKSLGVSEVRKCKGLRHSDFIQASARINKALKEHNEELNKKAAKQSMVLERKPEKPDSSEPLFDGDFLDIDSVDEDAAGDMVEEVAELDIDVPASIFRAYDIRGIVDETLTEPLVELIGKAIGTETLSRGFDTLCVGFDGRLSSRPFCDALSRGVLSTGANVVEIGEVPTPVLYYSTHHLETGSGVMITGSHNPANYNGFKMMIGGDTLAEDDIQKLYTRIQTQDFSKGVGSKEVREVDREYLDTILNDIAVAAPLRVVVDCGNGVAGHLAPELIEELGCEVIPLYCDVDGTFPNHHPDPGKPENLRDLIAKVQEEGADLGVAFDGDGDRVGVVTNEGKIIWPDRLLMLFAKDVVSRNPGADIIYDVKCSRRLSGLISNYGGRPVMWKTGHSLMKAKMKETGALLAGEMSGHVFFKERWFGFDDGLYSAARLLEILGIDERSASEIFDAFPEDVSTPEINVKVTDESKFSIIEKLCAVKEKFAGGNASTIDGLRVDFPNGWGLCRASNTTPMLVLRFEADDESALEEIKNKFKTVLSSVEPGLELDF